MHEEIFVMHQNMDTNYHTTPDVQDAGSLVSPTTKKERGRKSSFEIEREMHQIMDTNYYIAPEK